MSFFRSLIGERLQTNEKDGGDDQNTYIAIDFETANGARVSACALGIAWIQNGEVTTSESFLIKPPAGQKFSPINTKLHGIKPEYVRDSPTFGELWRTHLEFIFTNYPLILHNSSMDAAVLKACLDHYKIENYRVSYIDTMKASKKFYLPERLEDLCARFDIPYVDSHDPEQDALMCANAYLCMVKHGKDVDSVAETLIYVAPARKLKSLPKEKLDPLTEFNNNISTIVRYSLSDNEDIEIEGKTFVITGELDYDREYYKNKIEARGGFVKSGVSGKTDYVVVGFEFGPSKVTKLEEINTTRGKQIRVVTANQFYKSFA